MIYRDVASDTRKERGLGVKSFLFTFYFLLST
ncbi:MAG: hypothetical protein ACI9SC_002463 [Gammaproteobacteria bacterium]|jgi:hypothetical protein